MGSAKGNDADRDELIAYLDGELEDAERTAVEAELLRNPDRQRALLALEESWNLLDFLPMPDPGPDFVERTVSVSFENVTLPDDATPAVVPAEPPAPSASPPQSVPSAAPRVWTRRAVMAAAIVASFFAGRLVVAMLPNPSRDLVQELPVIERFDAYQAVPDLDFLRQLREARLTERMELPFDPDSPNEGGTREEGT